MIYGEQKSPLKIAVNLTLKINTEKYAIIFRKDLEILNTRAEFGRAIWNFCDQTLKVQSWLLDNILIFAKTLNSVFLIISVG